MVESFTHMTHAFFGEHMIILVSFLDLVVGGHSDQYPEAVSVSLIARG